ncbi:glutathione S-transferase [Xylariaceae sp. FL1651]|nr:glutathione S-transferase [Xylariaceae sp. FL1651]
MPLTTMMGYDPSKPVHAGPDDSWHGSVAPGTRFAPEPNRYHLYIGLFCPFAHRVNLIRVLKGLDSALPLSIVKPYPKGDDKGWPGWQFPGANGPDDMYEGSTPDKLFGSRYLHEVYFRADKGYKGRYSVPVLWDTKENTIVNNESLETLRWMQTGFNSILPKGSAERGLTLYPEHLRAEIDEIGEWMTRDLNTGVYKAGFAQDQSSYERGLIPVFAALNQLEKLIHRNKGPYILGKELTELDILAFATIIRFDVVYVQHFKCNLGTIRGSYPVIHEWLKNLYWNVKGFRETTNFKHIKENYTKSHDKINPLAITPLGPFPDIEKGVNLDFGSIQPGAVEHPAVLEHQETLPKG